MFVTGSMSTTIAARSSTSSTAARAAELTISEPATSGAISRSSSLSLDALGKPRSLINFVTDRLGHDRRYAIDPTKIERELGWTTRETWETGLERTIQWYLDNREWTERVRSGAYRDYYERQYGMKIA